MSGWSDLEYQACSRFIHQEVRRHRGSMDEEECLSEAWRAFLEARYSYRWVAGCCGFRAYAAVCIQESLDLMRRRRNQRISLESRLSLDMCFEGSAESVGARYFRKVGDFSGWVILKDMIERQEEPKRRVLWQMLQGLSDAEIMEEDRMDAQDYYRVIEELQEVFREWQGI